MVRNSSFSSTRSLTSFRKSFRLNLKVIGTVDQEDVEEGGVLVYFELGTTGGEEVLWGL